jgi:DNA polymerase-4
MSIFLGIFMMEQLENIANALDEDLKNISGEFTLKINDFTQQTRSKTLPYFISDKGLILETVKELLYQERMKDSVRLLFP